MTDKQHSGVAICGLDISPKVLNQLWQDRYPTLSFTPAEMVQLDRQSDANTRKSKQLVMGQPKLKFSEKSSILFLEFELRAVSEMEVILTLENGSTDASLTQVRWKDLLTNDVLNMSLSFAPGQHRHTLAYKTQPRREVSLGWTGAMEYSYSGSDTDKRLLVNHYDAARSLVLYQMPAAPTNKWLQDVVIPCIGSASNGIAYSVLAPSMASVGSNDQVSSHDIAIEEDDLKGVSMAIGFPENLRDQPPEDRNWLSGLLVPPGTATYDKAQDIPMPGLGFIFGWKRASRSAAAEDVNVTAAPAFISPLVSIVGAGFDRQLLEVSDPFNAAVTFVGNYKGKLESGGGTFHYVPPPFGSSAVEYGEDCKTRRAAVVLNSLSERSTTDVVRVTAGGQSADCAFVTLYAIQTHTVRCSLVSGRLTLELWYYDVNLRKDVRVADNETQWLILAGNGSVSSTGAFTPAASAPTPFTVVAGRDTTSTRLLYWAVTIIPMPLYTPNQVVEFFEG